MLQLAPSHPGLQLQVNDDSPGEPAVVFLQINKSDVDAGRPKKISR
jgi:hypothetical protein